MIFLLIIMCISVLGASVIVGFIIFDYFKVQEEFEQQSPKDMFMSEYFKIRDERVENELQARTKN